MERLTYWNEEYGCWSYRCPSGDAANRLAAYENICFDADGKELITIEELTALVKARDEGRLHIYEKSYKCPQCGAYRLTPRVDKLFYFCFCCRSQFTRAEAEAAIGGGGDG